MTTVDAHARGAVALLPREDGRILCVWNQRYRGWALPGGIARDGEDVEDALRRELAEECDVEAVGVQLVLAYDHRAAAPGQRSSRVHVYRVLVFSGVPREVEVGRPVTWLTVGEFTELSPFGHDYAALLASLRPSFSQEPAARRSAVDTWSVLRPPPWRLRAILERAGDSCDPHCDPRVGRLFVLASAMRQGLEELEEPDRATCSRALRDFLP